VKRLATVAVLLLAGARSAAGGAVEDAARDLDDPRWEVRRGAEAALVLEGRLALADAMEPASTRARLKAWSAALVGTLDGKSPTAAAAASRCLLRLERGLDDAHVRLDPLLLRVRIERLLPQTVTHRSRPTDGGETASVAIEGYVPEATPVLVSVVEVATDARRLAGALAALSGRDRAGPRDEASLHRIAQAWLRSPARFDAAAEHVTATDEMYAPISVVALALAATGRLKEAAECLARGGSAADSLDTEVRGPLTANLRSAGRGDLTYGRFLAEALAGEVAAADLEEAAAAAQAAGLPVVARLLARRALFLDASAAGARSVLVAADEALGLRRTAVVDGGGSAPAPGGLEDDPAALALDGALRAGTMGQRLIRRIEVAGPGRPGLPPVAIGNGYLARGLPNGWLGLVDTATFSRDVPLRVGGRTLPQAIAISGDRLAALSEAGDLVVWVLGPGAPETERQSAGRRWSALGAGSGGTFYVAGAGGRLARVRPSADVENLVGADDETFRPLTVAPLDGGKVLLAALDAAWVVDGQGGATQVLEDRLGRVRAAACGPDVVVAAGPVYARFGPDGAKRWEQETDAGRVEGVACDPATKTVYLAFAHQMTACDAEDGSVRWTESGVEGGGNPAVGDGLVAVAIGTGGFGGGARRDRTVSVLRGSTPEHGLFEPAAIGRLLAAAESLAKAGSPRAARMMVDPLRAWLTSEQLARVGD
jgi:hypothetical protein